MKADRSNIEEFIKKFKSKFPEELEQTFYHGYCYWFAMILSLRFEGDIWFNPVIVHFASRIRGNLYDIFGLVDPGVDPYTGVYRCENDEWYSWETYQTNHQDEIESIVDSCIKKV